MKKQAVFREQALTNNPSSSYHSSPQQVRFQERAFVMRHLTNVEFSQGDLLADNFSSLGYFDTVTVLHVLEYFTETDMYLVLANLLKVTSHRLIISVPYEPSEPETAYGHQQLFTRVKLEAVGNGASNS